MHSVNVVSIHVYPAHMSSALNVSSVLECFERGKWLVPARYQCESRIMSHLHHIATSYTTVLMDVWTSLRSGKQDIGFISLVPRPLPDFISQLWKKKSGEGLGAKLCHGLEIVESVSTNQVHVTY